MSEMTVNEFVRAKVAPELEPVVEMLRKLMREMAPDVREEIMYGIIGFKGRHMLAVINPTKTAVTFAFSRGAEFEDSYGLLRGKGKVSKHIKMRTLQDIPGDTLRYYIGQALELDSES
jgi:hypothetical protein